MLDKLPIDVWRIILYTGFFELGSWTLDDVFNILMTNRRLYCNLREDTIWSDLLRLLYKNTLDSYELERVLDIEGSQLYRNGMNYYYFNEVMRFYKKERILDHYSVKYKSNDQKYNVGFFVEKFWDDFEYIPILKNRIGRLRSRCLENFSNADKGRFDISLWGLYENILDALNFRIGLTYYILSDNSDAHPTSLEGFWFRIGHFDKLATISTNPRKNKLKLVRKRLHDKIVIPLTQSAWGRNVRLDFNTLSPTIIFSDDFSLGKFLHNLIRATLDNLEEQVCPSSSREDLDTNNRYCLKDFSLMRFYCNETRGHPLLFNSVLLMVIYKFLCEDYQIKVRDRTIDIEGLLAMNESFIFCCGHYYFIQRKTRHARLLHFKKEELLQHLWNERHPVNAAQLSRFMKQLKIGDFKDFLLNLDLNDSLHSLSNIDLGESLSSGSNHRQVEYIWNSNFSFQDYAFVRFLCKDIKHLTTERLHPESYLKCAQYLCQKNNIIHLKSICYLVGDTGQKRLLEGLGSLLYFNGPPDYFNDPSCYIKLVNIIINRNKNGEHTPLDSSFKIGKFVHHPKFKVDGIVLNLFEKEIIGKSIEYANVFISSKMIETYSLSSLEAYTDPSMTQAVAKEFFVSGDLEILGTLFFTSYDHSNICFSAL